MTLRRISTKPRHCARFTFALAPRFVLQLYRAPDLTKAKYVTRFKANAPLCEAHTQPRNRYRIDVFRRMTKRPDRFSAGDSMPSTYDARYRAIIDTAIDPIVVIDVNGTIVSVNPASARTFGYDATEMVGQNVSMLMDDPHRANHDKYLAHYLATGEQRIIGIGREIEARRKDGSLFPILLSIAEWWSDGMRFFTGIIRDISEQRLLRQDLERERAMLKSVIDHLPSGLVVAEAPTGRILSLNVAAERLLGSSDLTAEDVRDYARFAAEWPNGTPLGALDHPMVRAIQHGEEVHQEEIVYARPDGRKVTLLCSAGPVRGPDGSIVRAVTTFIDISERRALEARVEHLARYDPVTEIGNRVLFAERLEQTVKTAQKTGTHAGLVLIDLDRFKKVNDTMGHLAGDALLREVASRIALACRQDDTPARIGGDEFAVVLNGASSAAEIRAVAERVAATVCQPAVIGHHVLDISASVGFAVCPTDGTSSDALLRYADLALYEAKQGYERVRAFRPALAEEAERKAGIEADLQRAIDAGELVLHFQPQVDLDTFRISGVEALVRWQRGGRVVPPGEFIELAEASGTIHALGEWVIDKACEQTSRWRRKGFDFTVGINVSPLQADTPDFISIIDRALERYGLDGSAIELEITEGMLFNPESPSVAAFLGACKARKINLAIDDFGVGYSSLGYLARLPISTVKIDRSFVSRVGNSADESLLAAMIDLGHKLEKRVVAEGVETAEQCRYLRRADHGLHAQGYYFARPQTEESFGTWMRAAGRSM